MNICKIIVPATEHFIFLDVSSHAVCGRLLFFPTEFKCTKDEDCNSHGDCDDGKCDCDHGWEFADCSGNKN